MTVTVTKKCPHCDTAIEFQSAGQHVLFIAHDEASCHALTRYRVHMLERALIDQREAYEREIAAFKRSIDKMLAAHGLPSLAEQSDEAEKRATVLRTLAASPVADIDTLR